MPYNSTSNLPENLQKLLPQHAQEIYIKAYNNAHEQYKDAEKRRGNDDLETITHKVAWAAVEKVYKKDNSGKWVKK